MSETKFKQCKKCGSSEYDLFDLKPEDSSKLSLGKLNEVVPESCDKCNFELMLSDSNLLH